MSKSEGTSKQQPLIYVIAGKDDSLVGTECESILGQLLKPEERTTGFFSADANQVLPSDVFDELRTAPFLTKTRVVLVKGADKFVSANRQLLENYFDNPCSTGILILTVSNWDARTKLAKKLPKVGKLVSVIQPKAWQLPSRLTQYARDAHNKHLIKESAELLIELVGDNLPRLYSEIDKLAIYADKEKAITPQHIERLIGHNRIFGVFAVIDSVISGNAGAAAARLRNMFAEDRTAEYTTVGAFAFHFRRMFGAKVLLEKGVGTKEIADKLRIWGNKESFFAQLRKMSLREIGGILQQLAAIDFKVKTGQSKVETAMEQLVLRLAGG